MTKDQAVSFLANLLRDTDYDVYKDGTDTFMTNKLSEAEKEWALLLHRKFVPEIIKRQSGISVIDGKISTDESIKIYASMDSKIIKGANADVNYGDNTALALFNDDDGAEQRSLIKFDLSTISTDISGKTIYLKMFATDANTGGIYEIYRVKLAWTENGVTWNKYDGSSSWNTAGCGDSTDDYDGANQVCSGTTAGSADTYRSYQLDADLINAMCGSSPTFTNNGLVLLCSDPDDISISWNSRQNDNNKPYLEIVQSPIDNLLGGNQGIISVWVDGKHSDEIDDPSILNNSLLTPSDEDPGHRFAAENQIEIYPTDASECDVEYKEIPPELSDTQNFTLNETFHEGICKMAEYLCRVTLDEKDQLTAAARKDAYGRIAAYNEKVKE